MYKEFKSFSSSELDNSKSEWIRNTSDIDQLQFLNETNFNKNSLNNLSDKKKDPTKSSLVSVDNSFYRNNSYDTLYLLTTIIEEFFDNLLNRYKILQISPQVKVSYNKVTVTVFFYHPDKNINTQARLYRIYLKEINRFEKEFSGNFGILKQILIKNVLDLRVNLQIVPCRSIWRHPQLLARYIRNNLENYKDVKSTLISANIHLAGESNINDLDFKEISVEYSNKELASLIDQDFIISRDRRKEESEDQNLLQVNGYEIELQGRLKVRIKKPQPISQSLNVKWGFLNKKRAKNKINLKYAFDRFTNNYGRVGVKVWINYG